jgi:hypothetical protein
MYGNRQLKSLNYGAAVWTLIMGFNGLVVSYCDSWSAGLRVSRDELLIKVKGDACHGGSKYKDRLTVLLCYSAEGSKKS